MDRATEIEKERERELLSLTGQGLRNRKKIDSKRYEVIAETRVVLAHAFAHTL